MIRVMVVEDEPPIARSIKKLIEDYGDSVEVLYVAINGRRALEYIRSNKIDLIFTDIMMPVMDGFELARHINEEFPDTVMIIISGSQEFESARQAIRFGVQNYLLKPVSKESVHDVLDTVTAEITRRNNEKKRAALERAVSGKSAPATGSAEGCGMALVCAGSLPLDADCILPDAGSVFESTSIEELVNSVVGGGSICVGGKTLAEKGIVFPAEDRDTIFNVTKKLYGFLCERCELPVTFVVYGDIMPADNAETVFVKLRRQLFSDIRLFTSQYIVFGETTSEKNLALSEFGIELIQMLKTKDNTAMRKASLRLIDAVCEKGVRQNEFMVQLERLAINCFGDELSLQQLGELKTELQTVVAASADKEELAGELADVLFYQLKTDTQMEKDDLQALCESVAAHIRIHHRENITATALGKVFGFSSTQLSKKFKCYFGFSISEYLNKYRIELAQAIMRENKKLMVKEVAHEVGYNDQYYFSKIFKKLTGVWPTEYTGKD